MMRCLMFVPKSWSSYLWSFVNFAVLQEWLQLVQWYSYVTDCSRRPQERVQYKMLSYGEYFGKPFVHWFVLFLTALVPLPVHAVVMPCNDPSETCCAEKRVWFEERSFVVTASLGVVCRMRVGVMMDMRRHHHRFLRRGRRYSQVRIPLRPLGHCYRLLHWQRRSGMTRILRMNREVRKSSRPNGCQEVCRHFVSRGDSPSVSWLVLFLACSSVTWKQRHQVLQKKRSNGMVPQLLPYGGDSDHHNVYPVPDLNGNFLGYGFSLCDRTGSFSLVRVVFKFASSFGTAAGKTCQTKHICVCVFVQHQAYRRTDLQRWRLHCGSNITVFKPDRVALSGVFPVTVGMLSFGEFHITLGFVRLDYGDCGLTGPRKWVVCKNLSRLGDPCASGELRTPVVSKGVAFVFASMVGSVAMKFQVGLVLVGIFGAASVGPAFGRHLSPTLRSVVAVEELSVVKLAYVQEIRTTPSLASSTTLPNSRQSGIQRTMYLKPSGLSTESLLTRSCDLIVSAEMKLWTVKVLPSAGNELEIQVCSCVERILSTSLEAC